MLFISSMFAFAAVVMCFLVSGDKIFSVDKVVILYKDMAFGEVDMNGTRYAFANDRKIEEVGDQWNKLYITPVDEFTIGYKKKNLRHGYEAENGHREFIKEAFARCIGNISQLQVVDEPFDNKWVATFDHWYDNRFTGLIRYLLNKNSVSVPVSSLLSTSEPRSIFMNVVDDENKSNMYRVSISENPIVDEMPTTPVPYSGMNLRRRI